MIDKTTKVLIVDDFEPMRKVTTGQLKALGVHLITQASDGNEALRQLKLKPFDLILCDWNMPNLSGIELLKIIRADDHLRYLPFVMITAESNRGRVAEAITNGVSDILIKPYTAKSLSEKIERALLWKPRRQPISPESLAAKSANEQNLTPPKEIIRPSILIVDDTPSNIQLLSELFKDDYRIRVATNGETALKICTSETAPDLILLDIMMPVMDGFEVAQRMREHPNAEHIPIIFITAMTDTEYRIKGLALGAVDFVTKPFDLNELKQRVINFLHYVELHKNLQADIDEMLENARLHESVEQITRHDLKGLLAGVIALLHTLEEDESMNRRQLEQIRLVEESSLRMLNMINSSTELYKIETGHFKLDAQPVKIGEILRRIVEISRNLFREKRILISVETDITTVGEEVPQILGDAMLCYSLFQNLIKNACEAAPEKSQVLVSMKDENPMRIIIQNQGAVPFAIREHFFDKFVTYGKSGGTGLGTYSAKLLTEAQYGSIRLDVQDDLNQTTISVFLPRVIKDQSEL